jgi:hypothetical protein
MTTTTVSMQELQRFFELLYGDTVGDGYLVLSWPSPTRTHKDGRPALDNSWHNLATTSWQRIAERAIALAQHHSVYFGVALQHPTRQPNPFQRSQNASAYVLPGLYFDIDLAYGAHAASALPETDAEALGFLQALRLKPSLILHTGGGLHPYWLFETPIVLTTGAERAAMAHLMRQFAHTLCLAGKAQGWTLDALRDLARVLRPAGTVNHKYGKPVQIIAARDIRYTIADFDWLTPLPAPCVSRGEHTGLQDQPDVVTVIEAYGGTLTQKSEQEWHGTHPIHGSSTGVNLDVNLSKGLWHCWRHGTGGDALSFIALGERLLACENLHAGALGGSLFPHVLDVARTRFGWKPDPVDSWLGPRSTWHGVPRARREVQV